MFLHTKNVDLSVIALVCSNLRYSHMINHILHNVGSHIQAKLFTRLSKNLNSQPTIIYLQILFKCFLTQILRFEEWRQLLWHTGHGGYCDRKIYSAAHFKVRFCCPKVIHVFAIYSDIISGGLSSLWPFWLVVVSVCGGFGLWSFRFVAVAVLVCGRFGCVRFGLWRLYHVTSRIRSYNRWYWGHEWLHETPNCSSPTRNSPTWVFPMRKTPIWDISHLSHLPTNHEQPCNCCIIMFQRISSYPSGHWVDIITWNCIV